MTLNMFRLQNLQTTIENIADGASRPELMQPCCRISVVVKQSLSKFYDSKVCSGAGSSVGIATGYGLHGLGIETRWGRHFPHLSRLALGPTQPPVKWVPGISRGKEQLGRDADPSPPSTAAVKKE